jgi:uncharacterized Tic20 family protein
MSEPQDPQPAGGGTADDSRSPGPPPPPPAPPPPSDYPPGYPSSPPGAPPGVEPGHTPPVGYGTGPYGALQPQAVPPDEERLWSMFSHLSFFVFGIIAPLIIMLTIGSRSGYVRHHAVEALNFHITVWIASFVAGLTILLVIGIFLLPAVLIAAAVFTVIAAVRAYQGVPYRYPLSIRLIS